MLLMTGAASGARALAVLPCAVITMHPIRAVGTPRGSSAGLAAAFTASSPTPDPVRDGCSAPDADATIPITSAASARCSAVSSFEACRTPAARAAAPFRRGRHPTSLNTDSPSAWPCEGPLSALMRALGRRVGRCRLVAGPAGRRLSRSGQRCTLPFDPELDVALSVPTSIRRESLRQRHLGRGSGKNQLH